MSKQQLRVNPIICEAHGLCAELLPERIRLDDWGYPIVDPAPMTPQLKRHARRAVAACPTLALRLQDGDVLQPRLAHLVAGQLGALLQLGGVFAVGADAAHGHQRRQVADESLVVRRQPVKDRFVAHRHPPRPPSAGVGKKRRENASRVLRGTVLAPLAPFDADIVR